MEVGEEDDAVERLRGLHIGDGVDDEMQERLTLGFVEMPRNKWSLARQLFPSKAGGVPAWLDPLNLPAGRSRLCDVCAEPLQFLLQVYAPTSDRESTFHRTLYLFACPSMSCLLRDKHKQWRRPVVNASRSVKVFRSQLPRDNPFYSSEPPRHDGSDKPLGNGALLCDWCGTWKGDQVCGGCREARYCSRRHQAMHWRSGHKITCQNSSKNAGTSSAKEQKPASRSLWPEYEIINEDGGEYDVGMFADEDNIDRLQDYSYTRSWGDFQECIAGAPEQVLRYCRSVRSRPLWPMSIGRPLTANIPHCSYCGRTRRFEFQVLPQLLHFFGVKNNADSLDWATIAVYSCEASCEENAGYKEEFAWVQA